MARRTSTGSPGAGSDKRPPGTTTTTQGVQPMPDVPPVEWRAPNLTPRVGRRGWWRDRLTPLMERPGEWAMVHRVAERPEHAQQMASQLRGRHGRDYPPGEWEFAHEAATGEVFARYLGPAK